MQNQNVCAVVVFHKHYAVKKEARIWEQHNQKVAKKEKVEII